MGIVENLAEVKQRISEAARRAGRRPEDITLIAVTKTVEVERIAEAVRAGVRHLGENRVQEALDKYPKVTGDVHWHMIGHLQRNKVKYVLPVFELIHSLDSLRLAKKIEQRATMEGRSVDALVQVNVASEASKFGIPPEQLEDFLVQVGELSHLRVRGLMTIAPYALDPEEVRPVFARLRRLFERASRLSLPGVSMEYLSMGMSNDYEVAIEEGANMVRIGSAIFGPRR